FGDRMLSRRKRAIVTDSFAPMPARQAALEILLEEHNFMLAPVYHKLLSEPGLRLGALRGLAAYDVPATAPAILAVYPTFNAEEKRLALNVLAQRPHYARDLLAAVAEKRIPASDLDASLIRQL